jgi:hypothetical protein
VKQQRKNRTDLTKGRRHTAIHEAGHAVAYWSFGCLPYGVQLASIPGQPIIDRHGREVRAHGLVEASFFSPIDSLDTFPHAVKGISVRRAQIEAICAYAGPVAEARARKTALLNVLWTYGTDDYKRVMTVVDWMNLDTARKDQVFEIVDWAARRIMTEYRDAVNALADVILKERQVDGSRIDQIIVRATGRQRPIDGDVPAWLEPHLVDAIS